MSLFIVVGPIIKEGGGMCYKAFYIYLHFGSPYGKVKFRIWFSKSGTVNADIYPFHLLDKGEKFFVGIFWSYIVLPCKDIFIIPFNLI